MDTNATGICHVCGEPASMRVTEIHDGKKADRSLCWEHAPAEAQDQIPLGPHRITPRQEYVLLQERLSAIDRKQRDAGDWAQRAECEAEIKKVVADIAALRRRVGDVITDGAALRRPVGDAD